MALPAIRAFPEVNITTLESKFRFSSSRRSKAFDIQIRYIISQLEVAVENLGDYALEVSAYGLARRIRCSHLLLYRTVPRLFALIIGINVYQDATIPDLKGAVPDAEAIRKFILHELDVPQAQITILLDSQATRSAIIGAFQHLAVNPAIQRRDAILIYYAGHGSVATAPENWPAEDGKIQMLIPVDCGIKNIHGIPYKTIGSLITKVADNKGDNIVCVPFSGGDKIQKYFFADRHF